LSTLKEGDEISYVVNHEGYKKATGSFVVKTTAMKEDVVLTKLDDISKDKEINKVYGDESFNLKDNPFLQFVKNPDDSGYFPVIRLAL